jgi:type II restriction enzyme
MEINGFPGKHSAMPEEITIKTARERLDYIIKIARSDMYKPIQIAEVLYHFRTGSNIDALDPETYRNPSIHWRNEITRRLTGKISTSSARYQHDLWNETAMPPDMLAVLDRENKQTGGAIERYIYFHFDKKQETIATIITFIEQTTPTEFYLGHLLSLFVKHSGIRRSIDKAYEIVTYSLFETIVDALGATIAVSIPEEKQYLLHEFEDLASVLLGIDRDTPCRNFPAHIYRVGVTNAADRGLDMWANFGPAVQVKHLTLNAELAKDIVDQVESDYIIIVCKTAEQSIIETILRQIGWGKRVRGIVSERDLDHWYERCLRGSFADELGENLLAFLTENFKKEFPGVKRLVAFLDERSYSRMRPPDFWQVMSIND